jgi:hypothetical protein
MIRDQSRPPPDRYLRLTARINIRNIRPMISIEALLKVVDQYRAATGLSEARVSTIYFGGGHRLRTIREGGDVGVRRAEVVLSELSAHWPEGAEWPADVPRPVATEPAEDAA